VISFVALLKSTIEEVNYRVVVMRFFTAFALMLIVFPAFPATFGPGEVVSASEFMVPCVIDPPPPPAPVTILHDRNGEVQRSITTEVVSALTFSAAGLITSHSTGWPLQSIDILSSEGAFTRLLDLPPATSIRDLTPVGNAFVALVTDFSGQYSNQQFWRIENQAIVDRVDAPRGQYYVRSMDVAADRCTIFFGADDAIGRFNICTRTRGTDFARQRADALRVMPDGGLVAGYGKDIVRFDARGNAIRRIVIPSMSSAESIGAIALDVDPAIVWAITTFGCSFGMARVVAVNVDSGTIVGGPSSLQNGNGFAIAVAGGWRAADHPDLAPPRRRAVR
jgi:hypothetical protein